MEQEAEKLKIRFTNVNRAAFAREHKLKGGQAMIYQHINAIRPISLEAALVYAKGFGCPLEEISPRLAKEATEAAKQTAENKNALSQQETCETVINWPFSITYEQYMLISERDRKKIDGIIKSYFDDLDFSQNTKRSGKTGTNS